MSSNILNLSAGNLNGKAVSGDDIQFLYTFPFDLTGWHARLVVRSTNDLTGTELLDIVDPTDLVIVPGVSSTVTGWLPAAATQGNAYSTIYHALRLTNASSKKRTWVAGEIQLSAGIVEA